VIHLGNLPRGAGQYCHHGCHDVLQSVTVMRPTCNQERIRSASVATLAVAALPYHVRIYVCGCHVDDLQRLPDA
jgi:hypothetical protein